MKIQEAIIAKKYAKAFLNLFIDKISIKSYQRIVTLAQFLKCRRDILTYLSFPYVERNIQYSILDSIIKKFKLPEIFKQLVVLLVEDNRTLLFPLVLWYITIIYRQRKGILSFTIKSSNKLDLKAQKTVETFLRRQTNKKILSKHVVDKSLIAGIRLESECYLWEYSVAKKLKMIMHTPLE